MLARLQVKSPVKNKIYTTLIKKIKIAPVRCFDLPRILVDVVGINKEWDIYKFKSIYIKP